MQVQSNLRPHLREAEPRVVPGVRLRQRFGGDFEQPIQSRRGILPFIPANANAKPRLAQRAPVPVRDGLQEALREQVVHVDANILVMEGQQPGCGAGLIPHRPGTFCRAIQERPPTLLQKAEERLPIRHDAGERPLRKAPFDSADETRVHQRRNTAARVMPAQQHGQQCPRRSHQFRHDAEDVPQHEILAGVLAQGRGGCARHGVVERVSIRAFQRRHHGVVQVREQLAKAERQAPGTGEDVVRQALQRGRRGPNVNHQARLRRLRPGTAKARLVGVAEGDRILETEQGEPLLAQDGVDALVFEQPVRVRHDGDWRGAGDELAEDSLLPTGVWHAWELLD